MREECAHYPEGRVRMQSYNLRVLAAGSISG
jgi:hypothetical protein